MSDGVEVLYKNFGILADAETADITKHSDCYESIIQAAKGSINEKKLASGFITKFFRHFPALHDAAIDAILDLIEDEDCHIRRLAIKSLTDICKGEKGDHLYVKVSDVLTQLLPIEDDGDLQLVKMSLGAVLQMNTNLALVGIFDQILSEDETIREKGIQYVAGPLMEMRDKLFFRQPEKEKTLLDLVKKVLADVTGEEFELLMSVLSKLSFISTPEGSKELAQLISQQADLTTPFKADDVEFLDKFMSCCRQALKFNKYGCPVSDFLKYLCASILPVMGDIPEDQNRQQVVQLLAEACLCRLDVETVEMCIQPVYDKLIVYLPVAPKEGEEEPKLQFSIVECLLFAVLKMCAYVKTFLTSEEEPSKLKDLRTRLQYFARGSQNYHGQLVAALKDIDMLEKKKEQNKLRSTALNMTANINVMIKEFFHNPPTCKASITLSWMTARPTTATQSLAQGQRKRPASEGENEPKRKPSPIRFDNPSGSASKKETASLYTPPKDRFSKKVGGGFNELRGGQRGRGGRGRRNQQKGGGSWRK